MEAGVTRPVTVAIGLACVIVLGIVAIWGSGPGKEPDSTPGLTEINDPAELQKMVEMSHLGIVTSTNYLGHRIYTVKATLKNISNTPIRLVAVKMTFLDYSKKSIHEEVHPVFQPKQHPIEPGTEYRFEIPFENPPRTWNYHVPDTQVIRVAY